jgi:hypothetical protein
MSEPICPKCNRRVPAVRSKRVGDSQIRDHECGCGFKATRVVPASNVWRRKRYDSAQTTEQ